ncbi:MAG: hypothetical protein WBQ94_08820 [Terracidiphilus sp.]
MRKALLAVTIAVYLSAAGASAQTPAPSAASPLTLRDKFQLYFRQTYSVPSALVPAAFAALDQAADSPKEWGQSGQGYLNRLGTQRGQFQIGAFCTFAIGSALREDPRFSPSGKHGMWRRTEYVVMHTVAARTDRGGREPAFGNFAGALGAGFFPATWLPPSANTMADSLQRAAAMLGMEVGVNMGIEFGPDDRRFFREKVLPWFHRRRQGPGAERLP